MKRLLILFSILVALCLVFVSCGDETPEGEGTGSSGESGKVESSVPSSDTQGSDAQSSGTPDNGGDTQDSVDSSTGAGTDEGTDNSSSAGTDASTDLSSGTADGSTDKSEVTDSSVDSGTTDSNTDISSNVGSETTDSSDTQDSQDTPPAVDPGEGEDGGEEIPDGPIDIAVNGVTEYAVVYEADNERVEEFANKFVDYMSETHGIKFEMMHDETKNLPELCIYIGDVKGTDRVKGRLNNANDFGACVSGNDYVLYATNDRLYEFLYDVLVEDVLFLIRNKTWSTNPRKDFIYSQSEYKDVRYVDYILEKQGTGISKTYFFPVIFEDRYYVAADGTEIPYRLYVPYDYDRSKEYPVLLFMHGAGERGTNNLGNLSHMLQEMFSHENTPLWDSIIIVPQCPNDEQWVDTPWADGGYRVDEVPESNEIKAVLGILDRVAETFPTDKNRYYVMGLSMGGFGAWDLIMRHSDLFAAAVPICGGGDYTQAHKLVDMPIYTIHGTSDYQVPLTGTKEMVVALETLGSTVIFYEELKHYSHDVWSYAANKAEIWTWLFEQTREGR